MGKVQSLLKRGFFLIWDNPKICLLFSLLFGLVALIEDDARDLRYKYSQLYNQGKHYKYTQPVWTYPTYPAGQVTHHKSGGSLKANIWCHRSQTEQRCWDWGCAWDYFYKECRQTSLRQQLYKNPKQMTLKVALTVGSVLLLIFVAIRVVFSGL